MLHRRERPPAELMRLLLRDEHVASWAPVAAAVAGPSPAVVLATRFGLWWPFGDGPRRIGWERVSKAVWRDGVLSVIEADLLDDLLLVDRPAVSVSLAQPRDLPPTIRRRVEASVVESQLVALHGPSPFGVGSLGLGAPGLGAPGLGGGGGAAVRIVGRRVPGRDGVTWWARLEPGTPDSPDVRAAVTELLAARRAQRLPS